jgi:hypothetical protein
LKADLGRAVLIGVAPSLICAGIGHFGIQCAEGYSNCKINHPFSSLKTKHITNDTYIFLPQLKNTQLKNINALVFIKLLFKTFLVHDF